MKLQISKGNTKTGKIPAVSLAPIKSCPKSAPCKTCCYAVKVCRYSPEAKAAWNNNLELYLKNPDSYFEQLKTYMLKSNPKFFRMHTSGDIPDTDYLKRLKKLAKETPNTKYLLFTKRYYYNYKNLPDNLAIIFSMWNNYGNTRKHMPRAWMLDPNNPDPRIPETALQCPGNCETCNACWFLKAVNRDVVFYKH